MWKNMNKSTHLQQRLGFVQRVALSPSTPVYVTGVVIASFVYFRLPLELEDPLLNLIDHGLNLGVFDVPTEVQPPRELQKILPSRIEHGRSAVRVRSVIFKQTWMSVLGAWFFFCRHGLCTRTTDVYVHTKKWLLLKQLIWCKRANGLMTRMGAR